MLLAESSAALFKAAAQETEKAVALFLKNARNGHGGRTERRQKLKPTSPIFSSEESD